MCGHYISYSLRHGQRSFPRIGVSHFDGGDNEGSYIFASIFLSWSSGLCTWSVCTRPSPNSPRSVASGRWNSSTAPPPSTATKCYQVQTSTRVAAELWLLLPTPEKRSSTISRTSTATRSGTGAVAVQWKTWETRTLEGRATSWQTSRVVSVIELV